MNAAIGENALNSMGLHSLSLYPSKLRIFSLFSPNLALTRLTLILLDWFVNNPTSRELGEVRNEVICYSEPYIAIFWGLNRWLESISLKRN